MDMIHEDRSAHPGARLSGQAVLHAFYEGDYALIPMIGVWARQSADRENGAGRFPLGSFASHQGCEPVIKGLS